MNKNQLGQACTSSPSIYLNRCFDKKTLKGLIHWALITKGENFTILILEKLKTLGFGYATKAGISLSLDDLLIPSTKKNFLLDAQNSIKKTQFRFNRGDLTLVEKFQHLMDTWHLTSERLKQEVVENFQSTNTLNPVYMMAFSGARGNLSQVRQLVGMRGLMSDPQGQIIDFPIQSNFREGLTLTEYVISCYGARKGLVDTALRTANSGYLTRRLVDVAQHVIVCQLDCETSNGIYLTDMTDSGKTILRLEERLIGRVLVNDMLPIASQNTEITPSLAAQLVNVSKKIKVRSPLTCQAKHSVCQLCYGWSLAHGKMVSLGEAVGVLAAQSIGEPGTQLTMRTFHTGGVFSGESMEQIVSSEDGFLAYAEPIPGVLIRNSHGKVAFLTKKQGIGVIEPTISTINSNDPASLEEKDLLSSTRSTISFPAFSILFLRNGQTVTKGLVLAEYTSISKQANQQIQAKQTLTSNCEGQIHFEKVIFGIQNNREGQLTRIAHNFGSFWVLSGKVIPVTLGHPFRMKKGDKLFKASSLNQSLLTTPQNGYLISNQRSAGESKLQSVLRSATTESSLNSPPNAGSIMPHRTLPTKTILGLKLFSFLLPKLRFVQGFYWLVEPAKQVGNRIFDVSSCYNQGLTTNLFSESGYEINGENFKKPLFSWYPFLPKSLNFQIKTKKVFQCKLINRNLKPLPISFQTFAEYGISLNSNFLANPVNRTEIFWIEKKQTLTQLVTKQGKPIFVHAFYSGLVKNWKCLDSKKLKKTKHSVLCSENYSKNILSKQNKQELIRLTSGWVYWSKSKQNNYSFDWQSDKLTNQVQFNTNCLTDDVTFDQYQISSRFVNLNPKSKLVRLTKFDSNKINCNSPTKNDFSQTLWLKVQLNRDKKLQETILTVFGLVTKTTENRLTKNVKNIFQPSNNFFDQLCFNKTYFTSFSKNQVESVKFDPYRYSKATQQYSFTQIPLNFYQKNISNSYLKFLPQFTNNQDGDILDCGLTKNYSSILQIKDNNELKQGKENFVTTNRNLSINLTCHCSNLAFSNLKSQIFPSSSGILFNSFVIKNLQVSSLSNNFSQFEFLNKKQILTEENQLSESTGEIVYVTNSESTRLSPTTRQTNPAEINQRFLLLNREHVKQFSFALYKNEKPLIHLGQILRIGDLLKKEGNLNHSKSSNKTSTILGSPLTGQIIQIKTSPSLTEPIIEYTVMIRMASSVLFSSQGVFHVDQSDLVNKGTSLVTLFYQRLKTGDIVQGIPKIEEFFEARQTKQGEYLVNNLHEQLQRFFFKYQRFHSLDIAVRKSFQELQKFIVDGVQGVYQSQGVTISDKHLEIIVRQMTSIVRIVNGGSLGLLPGELVNLDSIELFNRGVDGQIAEYEPIVLGITKASLETKSFISAASFQETTRILSRAAVGKKTDFLRGLKESVIVGHLIPAGTGFFKYPLVT